MQILATVKREDSRESNGVEYCSATCIESGVEPMLQFFDYNLKADEKAQYKGKLVGKTLKLQIEQIRDVFSGRPQFVGRILGVETK